MPPPTYLRLHYATSSTWGASAVQREVAIAQRKAFGVSPWEKTGVTPVLSGTQEH
ncbi:MAG: hypothetical protein KME40_01485 [Komarekiella atlantica HA4396-MV6]|nr:hypothetical protein [Komarekiella atlantica HA4396-MV6]